MCTHSEEFDSFYWVETYGHPCIRAHIVQMLYFSTNFDLLMQSVESLEDFLLESFLIDSTADKSEALSQ